jgi:ankyrin repeat protein
MECPYCAGEIKDTAAKCRHCKEWLPDKRGSPDSTKVNAAVDIVANIDKRAAGQELRMAEAQSTLNTAAYEDLTDAAFAGDIAAILHLISTGADVNEPDGAGNTPLMGAAVGGKTDCVKFLIKRGANVESQNNDGQRALMLASNMGATFCVKALIDAGADVNPSAYDGNTALTFAAL